MSFRRWQASAAVAIRDRGLDLNDALGNLAPFITDTSDLLEVLDRQEEALRGVVRDTGTTFEALSERGSELTNAIRGGRNTFSALASEQEALAELFQILPVFQRESRATLIRLDQFQEKATPHDRGARCRSPQKLSPTLEDVRRLSPNLRNLFYDLRILNRVSLKGLPALSDFLDRPRAGDRRARALPREPQPDPPLPRLPEGDGRGLPDRPGSLDVGRPRRLPRRPGATPLPAPALGARHRDALDPLRTASTRTAATATSPTAS